MVAKWKQDCIAKVFMVWTSCACAAVIPCLFGGKWAPHFWMQINTSHFDCNISSLPPSLKIISVRSHVGAVVVLSSQAWQAFTYCAAKCNPLLSLCEEDFQRYIFHRRWQAVWSDNKQRGVGRREVIKTCSHIIIPTPSPSLRIFFFSRPSLPFRSLSPSQMKGPSQATWEMKMMERLIKKKSEEKKMKSGFEVARHISRLPPSDLPI